MRETRVRALRPAALVLALACAHRMPVGASHLSVVPPAGFRADRGPSDIDSIEFHLPPDASGGWLAYPRFTLEILDDVTEIASYPDFPSGDGALGPRTPTRVAGHPAMRFSERKVAIVDFDFPPGTTPPPSIHPDTVSTSTTFLHDVLVELPIGVVRCELEAADERQLAENIPILDSLCASIRLEPARADAR
jgi:hypothetical protein